MKLTKRAIDAAKYKLDGNKKDVRWDGALPGFGVRVYPSGRKSFVLFYRADARQRFMVLGDYGVLTLDAARKLAREKLVEVNKGKDPLADRQMTARGDTIADLCKDFVARHIEASTPKRPNGLKSARDLKRRSTNYIEKAWGTTKIWAVTTVDVDRLHNRIAKDAPYEANRVLAQVKTMFNHAIRWRMVPVGFVNPAIGVKPIEERARERWVTPRELPRLKKAIDGDKNIYVRTLIWLYLLVGLRKEELLSARWEDFDRTEGTLIVRDTKNGQPLLLPLPQPAVAMLDALPRVEGNPFIFPGRKKGAHLVNISKPWSRIRAKAGIDDVRIHDLRRTVGSWLAQQGATLHLVGRVLNHRSERTTKIYARLASENVRGALEQHGARLLAVAERDDGQAGHEGHEDEEDGEEDTRHTPDGG